MTLLPGLRRSAADRREAVPAASLLASIAAVLPLAVLTLFLWWRPLVLAEAALVNAALAYGAALNALLAGLHWSLARRPRASLAIALAAPLALLMPPLLGLQFLVAIFFLTAFEHVTAAERGRLPYWFATFSTAIAATAVVLLIAMMLRLFL